MTQIDLKNYREARDACENKIIYFEMLKEG
jgi:hypothetical protein